MSRLRRLAHKSLFASAFLRVEEHRFQFERAQNELGPPVTRLIVDRGDSVAALLFEPEQQLLHFVRQFRFAACRDADGPEPINGMLTELVAGTLEPGESPEACIIRETLEETGFHIENPRLIARFFPSPGASTELVYLYYADVSQARREDHTGPHRGVGDEEIEAVAMSIPAFLDWVNRMNCVDAKALIAADYVRRTLALGI